MRRSPLLSFFLIAYAFSWALSIPAILAEWAVLPGATFPIFFTLKAFGPAVAASMVSQAAEGRSGWRDLWRSGLRWRAGWQWYLAILVGAPALLLLGAAALPGAPASFVGLAPQLLVAYPISFVAIFFLGGPLGEEPGWRGFALPRMQARMGALRATLLLGALWTGWHLPDFLTSAQGGGRDAGLAPYYTRLPIFCLALMALSVIFTWVYNRTRGSLFIAMLLHASINTAGTLLLLFASPLVTGTDLPVLIGAGVPALLILALTRGRLGTQRAGK